jgi:hypothetical protein
MFRRRAAMATVVVVALFSALLVAAPADAALVQNGREWRQLYETTGLTWSQVASVCPTDGATPCSGTVGGKDLSGWVWATDDQVLDLMDDYAPELATADPPSVSGDAYFLPALGFLSAMRWTTYTALTYFYTEYTAGWTASKDAAGLPIGGGASFQHPIFNGSIGLGSAADQASPYRGVFLWRTAGLDYTPPVVTPVITGTLGTNGWYTSDVGVSWTVADPESAITSTIGCGPLSVAVDTVAHTVTCTATSAGLGGPGSGSATIRRDATPPTITCAAPVPTFDLGQFPASVSGTVTDATSGVATPVVSRAVSTGTVGTHTATLVATDRAGNTASRPCPYQVGTPTCLGLTPTIVGTPGSDVINGTAGNDVIHGLYGNDTIDGKGGNDVICGGDSADSIRGGKGNDLIDGGSGADTVYGDAGKDIIAGGSENDSLYGGGADDDLNGGDGSDSIRGDAGVDRCSSGEQRMSSCAVIY